MFLQVCLQTWTAPITARAQWTVYLFKRRWQHHVRRESINTSRDSRAIGPARLRVVLVPKRRIPIPVPTQKPLPTVSVHAQKHAVAIKPVSAATRVASRRAMQQQRAMRIHTALGHILVTPGIICLAQHASQIHLPLNTPPRAMSQAQHQTRFVRTIKSALLQPMDLHTAHINSWVGGAYQIRVLFTIRLGPVPRI